MRNFPDFIAAFMEYTRWVEAPTKFLKWSAISTVAGALERKVWINFKDQISCYPNHYICLIGDPGLAKKSSSSRQAVSLLQGVEGVTFGGTQMTTAGLIDELRKVGTTKKVTFPNNQIAHITDVEGLLEHRFAYETQKKKAFITAPGDSTFAHSAIFIYSSEAAVTLKGDMQNMLIQNLTDLYDGGPEGWNQKAAWLKRLKNEETKIFNPCINMLACSTPVWLVDSIGRDNLDSGFASRILFVVQKGRPERSFGWKTTPSMKFMRGKLIEDLIEINALQGEFETTQCFRDGFDELDEINKAFIEKNPGHLMLGYYARKLWHVLKLSQVLHCSRSDDMLLTGQVFQEAVTVIEGLEDGMEGAFQKATMSNGAKLLTRVWHYLLSLELGEPLPTENVRAQFIHEEDNDISRVLNQLQVLKKTKTRVHEGKICVEILDPTPLD